MTPPLWPSQTPVPKRNLVSTFALTFLLLFPPSLRADDLGQNEFGINEHILSYEDYPQACDEIIASGVKWVRISSEWGALEPSRGYHDPARLAKVDYVVNRLTSSGVNILWVLCYTAPWASSVPASNPWASRYRPLQWSDWENFVSFLVGRYPQIKHWEVWNEPDSDNFWKSSDADYAELLRRAAIRIRAASSANKVLLGGLALSSGGVDSYGIGSFLDVILTAGAAQDFDLLNYHAYGGSPRWMRLNKGMQDVINKHGLQSCKIWLTEVGYSTSGNSALEYKKADYVDQTYVAHLRMKNVERLFWYVYRSPTVPGNELESNFGLENNARVPLRAYSHFQAIGGAETEFALQKQFPSVAAQTPSRLTLKFVSTAGSDGSSVTDYVADGSVKRIAAGTYMYLQVQDSWLYDANGGLDTRAFLDVTYLDTGNGSCTVHYDAQNSAYQALSKVKTGLGVWKVASFPLDNVKFANRQNWASDLRLYAAGSDLIVSRAVIRKEMQRARLIFGSSEKFRLLERTDETNSASVGYAPLVTSAGLECRRLLNDSKMLFFNVSDGFVNPTDTHVTIGIKFLDTGTDTFILRYNAIGNVSKGMHIQKTGTGTWRYIQIPITDANFVNGLSYNGDFGLSNGADGGVEDIAAADVTINRIGAKFATTEQLRLITQPLELNPGNIGYTPAATVGGEECRAILDNGKSLFFQVADAFVRSGDTQVTIGINYWDAGVDSFILRYNAIGNPYKGLHIQKTNTNTWKYVQVQLTDADFKDAMAYNADFSLSNGGDNSIEYIRSTDVQVPSHP